MRKKIFYLLIVFVVLAGVAVFLVMKGQPQVKNLNPLVGIKSEQVAKLSLASSSFSVVLEKKDGHWTVVEPLIDQADEPLAERVVSVLRGFVMGSVINENSEKHAQFQVDSAQGLNIKLFTLSNDKPVLDVIMGKEAAAFGNSYVRFSDQNPVYLAEGLATYVIPRTADGYRARKVFQFDPIEVSSVTVVAQKKSWTFVRSSETWVNMNARMSVDSSWMDTLLQKFLDLQSYQFEKIDKPEKKNGLDKPVMVVDIGGPSRVEHVVVGSSLSEKDYPDLESGSHLVLVSGRPDPLAVQSYVIKDISDFLSSSK